ncbi:MAG: response regulator transcription factor [Chloroflexota bacterium]
MTEKTRILFVSSDPKLLKFLPRQLRDAGFQVVTTPETGGPLNDVLDQENPDFIILDIMAPQLDGIEVSLRIRQWSKVPILMLTAWGAGEDRVRALDLTADGYLTESFGVEEVVWRIEKVRELNGAASSAPFVRSGSV